MGTIIIWSSVIYRPGQVLSTDTRVHLEIH